MAGPTNSDLLKEIMNVQGVLEDHEKRIRQSEDFIIAYNAAAAALKDFKQERSAAASVTEKGSLFGDGISTDFVNITLKFLGIIASALTILYWVLQHFLK